MVTTYNRPDALVLCLQSLAAQSDLDFEVIVADDGSTATTRETVAAFASRSPFPLRHVWQPDLGYRRAKILNAAIAEVEADYLIFMDGDCVAQPDFVRQHRRLGSPGRVVTGSRVMLSQRWSDELLAQGAWDQPAFRRALLRARLRGDLSKLLPFIVRLPPLPFRNYSIFEWRRIKGCNLAAWRTDLLAIGGYDESFVGWGHEDADLVFRLHRAGVKRRSGAFATEVLHLWHPAPDMSLEPVNRRRLESRIEQALADPSRQS